MLQNKVTRNFLLLISGITLLFCAAIPDLGRTESYVRHLTAYSLGLGSLSNLTDISLILFVLGGTALTVLGIVFTIIDNTKAKRPVDWVVAGCAGGGSFFTLLSLVPDLFWIGFLAVPAFVVAAVFAFKDVKGEWKHPLSAYAVLLMVFLLIGMYDRECNVIAGRVNLNYIGALTAIAAFVGFVVFKSKLDAALDEKGKKAFLLLFIAAIIYAAASLLNIIPVLNIVGFVTAIGAWVVMLIGFISLMGTKSFGEGNKAGMWMLIAHCVGTLSFIPLVNLAVMAGFGFGFFCLIDGLEKKQN